MGPTNKQLQIVMKMRDEVTKKITTLEGRMKQLTNRMKQNWVQLAAKVFLFQKALQAVGKAMQFIEAGARIKQQQEAFQNLVDSVGANAEQLVDSLKRMSGQTLSTSQIIEKASQAIILGLDPGKLAKMMEISRAAARAFGQDVGFMFESIALGIGRQSRMILDNLGIIVKSEQAYEDYAKELGKTKNQLTEAEKRQAFMNAAMKAGEDIIKKVNIQGKTQAENIETLKSTWNDFNDRLSEFLNKSKIVKGVIEKLSVAAEFWSEKMKAAIDTVESKPKSQLLEDLNKQLEDIGDKLEFLQKFPVVFERDRKINENLIIQREILQTINRIKQENIDLGEKENDQVDRKIQVLKDLQEKQTAIDEDTVAFRKLVSQIDDENRIKFEADLQSKIELLKEFHDIQLTAALTFTDLAGKSMAKFQSGMSGALSDIILGTKKASEAFKDFGKAMVKTIVDWIAQKSVAIGIELVFGKLIKKVTSSLAASLASAWAPAAALASLATLGGNAGPASAALVATASVAQGIALTAQPRARGGDEIVRRPTLFLAGEAGPERATFTPLGGHFAGRGGGGVNITLQGPFIMQSDEDIGEFAERIGSFTQRQLRYKGFSF